MHYSRFMTQTETVSIPLGFEIIPLTLTPCARYNIYFRVSTSAQWQSRKNESPGIKFLNLKPQQS